MSDTDDATRVVEAVLLAAGSALRHYEPHTRTRIIEAATKAMAAANEPNVEAVAWAILKARFFDCEPDVYASLDAFRDELRSEFLPDAMLEANAAIRAMKRSA